MKRSSFITIGAMLFLVLSGAAARAQSSVSDEGKFEVGGQFSVFNVSPGRASALSPVQCVTTPCLPVIVTSDERETEFGFGARIGYNVTEHVTLEAEGNFFPRDRARAGGRKLEGLFGAKVGKRYEQVGVFAKARPGFVRFEQGSLRQPPNTVCVAVFPPPAGCFESRSRTQFAFDLGGVLELYPSRRTIVRFDAGDTIIRFGERAALVQVDPPAGTTIPTRIFVGRAPADTTHNFQASVGFGFRF